MKKRILIVVADYYKDISFGLLKSTKNNLIAAYDIAQNVGVIDSFFPEAKFFFNYSKSSKFWNYCSNFKKRKIPEF